jgi:hypothetical protein
MVHINLTSCSRLSDLLAFHRPADQGPRDDAYRKRRHDRERAVSLKALSRVVQELFGSITALLAGTPHYTHTIVDRIAYRTGCAGSPLGRFSDVFSRSFHYVFGHFSSIGHYDAGSLWPQNLVKR